MSKVTYIIKASNDVLNEKTSAILIQVAKQKFITSAEIRENLAETLNASSVNSNIGVLIKKGFIEKSGEGFITTILADDTLAQAAHIYAEENTPELVKPRKTRKAREISAEMEAFKDYLEKKVAERFTIKNIELYRSNYIIRLESRHEGIRIFEIRNKGEFRVVAYKVTEEMSNKLQAAGMSAKIGSSNNAYFDIDCTEANIDMIIALV
ncbi:putative transcriptional regulator [Yersinia phage MHG19]|nr:putative transcriptional regulator [Yersinia phage MHG19]